MPAATFDQHYSRISIDMPSAQKESISKLARRLAQEESGATAVEYGIMVAAIAAVIITVVFSIGFHVRDAYTAVDTALGTVVGN